MEIKSSNLRKILGLDEPPRRVTEKVRGVMTFDHKTGGSVQVMSAESYERTHPSSLHQLISQCF